MIVRPVLGCACHTAMLRPPPWLRSLGPLVSADLHRRYAGSLLGGFWAILGPLLEAAAYALVFGWILGAARAAPMPYAVLIASGLFPWISLRESLEGSASVLADNRWIRRSRVPAELLVARLVLASSLRALVGLAVVMGFAVLSARNPGLLGWIAPLFAFALQIVGTYGLGLLVAPVGTLLPDSRPTLASLLTLLTFASPIVYPESLASGTARTLLLANPFTHLLRLYRSPIEPLGWRATLVSAGVASCAALAAVAIGQVARRPLWWKARDVL
jgi:homopolymeric O-antigen transport system permease protein